MPRHRSEQTKIVIADDHPIFRAGLRQVVESDHSFKVVGEASDGETALRMTQQLVPDVVILDVNMPGLGGFAVIADMKRRGLAAEIVVLTMHSEEGMFSKAMSVGVRGYVLKDGAAADIVSCLQAIRRGQAYTSAAVTNYLFKCAAIGRPVTGIGSLTPTERMVLRLSIPPFYRQPWFYALAMTTVLVSMTLLYRYRVHQLQVLNESRAAFARQLIESQESERRRIALELHDSLGQTLAVIRNRTLIGLGAADGGQALEQLREISEASSLALSETREIAHNLHPAQLENLGLTTALRTLVESVEGGTGLKCEAEIAEVPDDLPYEAAIAIYRISQECLSNIIKHSGASLARVLLRAQDGRIVLTTEDDGRGLTESPSGKGLGLQGIRERALIIGAQIKIDSRTGAGSRVTLSLDRPGPART